RRGPKGHQSQACSCYWTQITARASAGDLARWWRSGHPCGLFEREGWMAYLNDNRLRAECFGTLCLVLICCSSVVLAGFGIQQPMGFLAIALTFGLVLAGMAYAIGPISGCHINPAVTAAMWSAGRINSRDAIAYVVAQLIGGILGALLLYIIIKGRS